MSSERQHADVAGESEARARTHLTGTKSAGINRAADSLSAEPRMAARTISALQGRAGNRVAASLVQRHSGPIVTKPASALVGGGKTATDPAKRKANVEEILGDSAIGKAAVKTANDYKLNIDWAGASGGGSYFQEPLTVVFDVDSNDEDTALGYVHEMNHARQYHLGLANDINSPRDEYLAKEFTEETEGTVQAIEAKVEINATAKKAAWFWETPKKLAASFAFEDEYHKAYKDCVDKLPWLTSSEEKAKAGRKAGFDVIYKGFMDGTIKTSMPGNPSYVEWYGKMWDDHAAAKASASQPPPVSTATSPEPTGDTAEPTTTPTTSPTGA